LVRGDSLFTLIAFLLFNVSDAELEVEETAEVFYLPLSAFIGLSANALFGA